MIYNILAVEDDPFAQHFYKYLFKKYNHNLFIEEDGEKIFSSLKEKEISIIILDINLKNTYLDGEKTNGILISKKIKQDSQFSHIPILLVTAYSEKIVETNYFKESLADDYITKPISDFKLFINQIDSLVTSYKKNIPANI